MRIKQRLPVANNRSIIARLRDSLSGLVEGWHRDRAFRVHLFFSLAALAVLALAQPPIWWVLACLILLALGMAVELINAAIEALLDRIHPELHSAIGAAKEMSSAAAFVINAAAVGALVCAVASSVGALP